MLYIIYGASGAGKKGLCETINSVPTFHLIVKGTTRKQISTDGKELVYLSEDELKKNFEIIFPYFTVDDPHHWFGIKEADIKKATENADDTYFIFCNHLDTIVSLCEWYENIRVFLFQIDDYHTLFRREKKDNPDLRIKRMDYLYSTIRDNMFRIDDVIFYKVRNAAGRKESNENVRTQVFNCIRKDHECKEYIEAISKDIVVMMPQGIRTYERAHYNAVYELIKNTIESNTEYHVKRIVNSREIIIKDILDSIRYAKLVIVDLSQARNNCYFEAGYALGQNKQILFLCDSDSEIGYNMTSYNIKRYDYETRPQDLSKLLLDRVKTLP